MVVVLEVQSGCLAIEEWFRAHSRECWASGVARWTFWVGLPPFRIDNYMFRGPVLRKECCQSTVLKLWVALLAVC